VREKDGRVLGALVATQYAKTALGAVRMEDATQADGDGAHMMTVLLGPRGNDRNAGPNAPPRSDLAFLVHPGLPFGSEHALGSPTPTKLRKQFGPAAPPGRQFEPLYVPSLKVRDYRDPVPGYTGAWLAAFAPVGKTGFVVIVQTRREAAVAWAQVLGDRSLLRVGLATFAGLLAISAVAFWSVRRRRRAP
jgi:hypothetical protein